MCDIHTRTRTSVRSVRPCHNTRGMGTPLTFVYLPGICVSSEQLSHLFPQLLCVLWVSHTRTRNFGQFYTTFKPVPGLLEVTCARATIPGGRIQHSNTVPGISVSSVLPYRDFCELCMAFVPVPETSVTSSRLSHPYPKSTNPTEHSLVCFPFLVTVRQDVLLECYFFGPSTSSNGLGLR